MSENRLHYNPAQLRCLLQYPNRLVGIMGRGTGKSTGILSPRMARCAINMPGSNNGLLAKSFKQIQTRTFPAIESGWRKLGLKEWDPKRGGHYTIGKRNDAFPMPEKKPDDWRHTVHWFTGSIFSFSSQDRKGDSNGLDLQSIHADEAKQIDAEDLNDSIIPTLRGMTQYKHLPEYRMLTYTTDMPTTPDGKWLLDLEEACDPDVVKQIFQFQIDLQDAEKLYFSKDISESYRRKVGSYIAGLNKKLAILQRTHTYYAEASSFDNIDMLTPEYIETQRRNLPDFVFNTAILNMKPLGLEHGQRFYPQLSKKNFYTDFDYSYLDTLPSIILPDDKDTSRGDRDCQHDQPLEIVIDWGAKINSMLVCQEDYALGRFNVLKEFFALQPEIIPDLILKFCKYYIHHKDRLVYLYYDRNGNAHMANSKETYAEYAQRLFDEQGWTAVLMSFSENPSHQDKFEFMNLALTNKERQLPKLMINEENCPSLKIALYNAPLKLNGEGEVKKDKKSEQSKTIPQQQATHVTDCLDIIYCTKYRKNIEGSLGGYLGLSVA